MSYPRCIWPHGRIPLGATLLLLAMVANAEPYIESLDALEVTATRSPASVLDTLPSTTVITRQDIEQSQLIDLVSILRQAGGVEIAQSGGMGAQASVFMRGSNSDQTLIMIDGVRINSVEAGGAFLQHIMLSQVDHIEIVRGNVSAVYGSQAVGGVIQIFTRSNADLNVIGVDVTVGGDDTQNAAVHAAGSMGPQDAKTSAAFTASTSQAGGGFSAIDASIAPFANPNDNPYRNRSFSADFGQQIGPVKFSAHLFDSEAHLSYDDPTNYTFLDPMYSGRNQTNFENSELQTLSLSAHWQLAPRFDSELIAAAELDRSDNNSSFPGSFVIGSARSQTDDYTWNNHWVVSPEISLNAGLEDIQQAGDSTAYGQRFNRTVQSAFFGAVGHVGPNQFQLNLRTDHYSDFGSANSGLLAYGFALSPQWKLIAQLSTAFDAPTFDDLYYPGFSNPELQPEKARSSELAVQFHDALGDARLALYRSTIHDLIVYDATLFVPENIDEARLEGIELSGATHWQSWQLSGNATLDHPIDVATDQPLLRRATHGGNVSLSYNQDAWQPFLQISASGLRFDSDINSGARVTLGGYAIANAGVRYVVSKDITVGVAADNFLARKYALVDGYNTPGRVIVFTLSGQLPR